MKSDKARIAAAVVFAGCCIAIAIAQTHPPENRGLLDLLVFGTFNATGSERPFDPQAYPPRLHSAIRDYIGRKKEYRSTRRRPRTNAERDMVWQTWTAHERRLAAISAHPKAPTLAKAYVDRVRPCYEWEGGSECPQREAIFAERYLAVHPRSVFREYLPLLAAHRWLCTAEGYDYKQKPEDAARSRRAYENDIRKAVRSADPLIRTAAEELRKNPRCTSDGSLP